jgi:ketosteroid isomerase-like protein
MLLACALALSALAVSDPADVLRAADRAFFRATRERGLEGWLAAFADDAVVFPPAGPLAADAAARRKHYASQAGFPAKDFVWDPEDAGLAVSADFGWTRGRWGSDASGQAVWAGQYLSVWRKEASGVWKVVADCTYDADFATRCAGLAGAPMASGSEAESTFRSAAGDLTAVAGTWWMSDAEGGEVGGKFLALWRRRDDGTQERLYLTGLAQAKR